MALDTLAERGYLVYLDYEKRMVCPKSFFVVAAARACWVFGGGVGLGLPMSTSALQPHAHKSLPARRCCDFIFHCSYLLRKAQAV